jgi:geranylgeranyl pyrophosphate synthase
MASQEQRKVLDQALSTPFRDPAEKIARVKGVYLSLGIDSLAEATISQYTNRAFEQIDSLKVDAARKEPLLQLAAQMMKRAR